MSNDTHTWWQGRHRRSPRCPPSTHPLQWLSPVRHYHARKRTVMIHANARSAFDSGAPVRGGNTGHMQGCAGVDDEEPRLCGAQMMASPWHGSMVWELADEGDGCRDFTPPACDGSRPRHRSSPARKRAKFWLGTKYSNFTAVRSQSKRRYWDRVPPPRLSLVSPPDEIGWPS